MPEKEASVGIEQQPDTAHAASHLGALSLPGAAPRAVHDASPSAISAQLAMPRVEASRAVEVNEMVADANGCVFRYELTTT